MFSCQGELVSDRNRLKHELYIVWEGRFYDKDKSVIMQQHRLARLFSAANAARLDGRRLQTISLFDTLQARAEMKSNTSGGIDLMPTEVYKSLPFVVCILYWLSFRTRQQTADDAEPLGWKILDYVGIPKPDAVNANTFDKLRWIAQSCVSQKWYQRTVRAQLRLELKPTKVATYGFKKHKRTTQITGIFRQVLHTANMFQGFSIFVACADIRTAFDEMLHGVLEQALLWHNVHPLVVFNILRELSFVRARMKVLGCDVSDLYHFLRGGKQGGVDTPDLFTEWCTTGPP